MLRLRRNDGLLGDVQARVTDRNAPDGAGID
jgi:hypothetical protein